MKKELLLNSLLVGVFAGSLCSSALAGSYSNDFNTDPAADPNFAIRAPARWVSTGSYNGSGYISLTDAVNDRNGTIVLPDLDGGAIVIGFNFKAKVRIGGGTARPADGLSVSFCDPTDPVVGGGPVNEEGTASGLVVSLDTYDNGNSDGPALDIKVNNVIVAHKRFSGDGSPGFLCCQVETDSAGNPISLETDPAGTPAPGTWVDLEISVTPAGAVSVKYKGIQIYQDVPTGFTSRPGRFVVSGRTGGANDNHWIDDLQITTTTSGDSHPYVSSSLPAGNPARDATGTQLQFVVDSLFSFFDPVSPQLLVDGVDVTANPATTIVSDEGLRTLTVTYTPPTPWEPSSRHEAVLNYSDTDTPPVSGTVRKTILVSPVVPATAAGTTLFIEAEDFNYSDGVTHGQFYDFGSPAGSYNTKAAGHDVDYHLAASNPDSPLYRVLTPPNGISIPGVPDNLRAGVPIDVTMDYKVGWNDPGDWFNFTRTFPNTTYKIYGRFASGGLPTAAELSKVTSDPTAGGQTTASLGTFRAEATEGWDTFCFIPLRDASGQDVIVRLNGLSTLRVTCLPGNYDFNYLAFVPTLAPTLRPSLASATPEPGSESLRDGITIKAVIADRDTQVVAGSIRLFLDDVELTPVVRTDTPTGAEGQFQLTTGLPPGSAHTAKVIFADNDAIPVTQTNSWNFTVGIYKSGSGTLFIEAEDFNYSNADGTGAGQHANFGDPDCSLLGKPAVIGVDYNEVNTGNDAGEYRGPTAVEGAKQGTDGFVRGDHTISCSYIVGWNDAGDWYNYTRDFGPSARYNVYARLSSGGLPESAELSLVTSNPTQPGQTTSRLGGFNAPATGNWDIFHTVPLLDASGNLASVRLGGLQTLRFTTLPGNFDYNYLALVKADVQVVTPTIASVSPAQNSDYARAAKVTAVVKDEDSLVVASSLRLTFDGSDVTASSTITDTPTGAMIVYQSPVGSPVGTTHTVTVTWRDDQAAPVAGSFTWTYKEGPYNPDLNLFIEAEDFNSDFAAYYPSTPGHPFNEKGLYNGLGAVPDIDYHDSGDGQESNLYRTEGVANIPHVNMVVPAGGDNIGGVPRPGFETVPDYKIGWTDSAGGGGGDWYNYTRNFGDGAYYNIYLRASHGDAAATIGGRLEIVDDPVSSTPTTTPLGSFRAPATGGWDTFTFVPLKAPDGSLVEVPLSGVKTLRYTVEASGGDINFLMLSPVRLLNECPTANPLDVAVDQNSQVNFQLQGSDPEGGALEYSVVQGPAHGNVVVQPQTGAATYTPTAGYYGPDSFTYRVSDGRCASAPVTVSINVRLINRAPTARIIATPLVDFSPEVVNKLVISYNGSNACLLLDGSTSSDPESPLSALTFGWFIVPSPIPFAEGVLATGCLDIGSHVIQLSVRDPQGAEGLDTLAVDVVTASEAIEELIALVNDSTVARTTKRPFIASLKSAAAASDRGDCNAAQNVLRAFQNKVRAQVEPNDPATAAVWIRWAQEIIDALDGCVTPAEP